MGKKHKKRVERVPVTPSANATSKLFCYGTLNIHAVQQRIFGESMQGTPAVLTNYEMRMWPGSTIFYIERKPGEKVVGKVYELTKDQLERTDIYESEAYDRVRVQTADDSWVEAYVKSSKGVSL